MRDQPTRTTATFAARHALLVTQAFDWTQTRGLECRRDGGDKAKPESQAENPGDLNGVDLHRQLLNEVDLGSEGVSIQLVWVCIVP